MTGRTRPEAGVGEGRLFGIKMDSGGFRLNAEGIMRDDMSLKKALDTLTAHMVAAGMPVPSTGVALYLASDQDTLLSPREFDVHFHDQLRRQAAWMNFLGEGLLGGTLIVRVTASAGTAAAGRSTRLDMASDASLPHRNWQAHPEFADLLARQAIRRLGSAADS